MYVPLSWLQDYVDLPEDVNTLRDLLTFSGLEVEGVETHGADFSALVVAEILAVHPHPNADRLTICDVALGGEIRSVVCGAPNVRAGLKTIYAPVGATLPNGLTLKPAKIRGVESLGMLCAEDELGLSTDHSGIMELDPSLAAGTPAPQVLGGPEVVFELEITPNRPDCLSIIGVARELAALTGRPLRLPDITLDLPKHGTAMQVDIRSSGACPRYTALLLGGATVGPAPEWMQKRLRLCGVRPINNLVDITNYVMLESGQPLHAFDRAQVHGDSIIVRHAVEGEILHTLDGQERKLLTTDLVIADAERALALAGVMGGAGSEIRDTTSTVLLESAAFESSGVRATAKRLHLHSESSHRFARGCDTFNCDWVSLRAASLICAHAGATPLGPMTDNWPGRRELRTLSCRWKKITDLIGIDIPVEKMRGYFQRLGLDILSEDDEGCTLRIPGFRGDLTRPVDLTEEIARLNGLDQIPAPTPRAELIPTADDYQVRFQKRRIWQHLAHRGFLEIMNYSLTAPELLAELDAAHAEQIVRLPNPISQDQSVLRTSLLPHMAETLARNKSRQTDELLLFEVGATYLQATKGVNEATAIAFGQIGPVHRPRLDKQRPVGDAEAFFSLKGELESLFESLGCAARIRFEVLEDKAFCPGQAARILLDKTPVGRIGLLCAKWKSEWKFHEPVALAEVLLEPLLPPKGAMPVMKPVPAFPSVTRDVALIVDRARTHADVMAVINAQRPGDLESVDIFDVFEGKKLGENRKSLAYRFTYRNAKKTLTDEVVEKMHGRIVQRLTQELGAEIAGG
jgi:phenylalanyl-tRNA synthetase beta chain